MTRAILSEVERVNELASPGERPGAIRLSHTSDVSRAELRRERRIAAGAGAAAVVHDRIHVVCACEVVAAGQRRVVGVVRISCGDTTFVKCRAVPIGGTLHLVSEPECVTKFVNNLISEIRAR